MTFFHPKLDLPGEKIKHSNQAFSFYRKGFRFPPKKIFHQNVGVTLLAWVLAAGWRFKARLAGLCCGCQPTPSNACCTGAPYTSWYVETAVTRNCPYRTTACIEASSTLVILKALIWCRVSRLTDNESLLAVYLRTAPPLPPLPAARR